jgi:hypothetical protein
MSRRGAKVAIACGPRLDGHLAAPQPDPMDAPLPIERRMSPLLGLPWNHAAAMAPGSYGYRESATDMAGKMLQQFGSPAVVHLLVPRNAVPHREVYDLAISGILDAANRTGAHLVQSGPPRPLVERQVHVVVDGRDEQSVTAVNRLFPYLRQHDVSDVRLTVTDGFQTPEQRQDTWMKWLRPGVTALGYPVMMEEASSPVARTVATSGGIGVICPSAPASSVDQLMDLRRAPSLHASHADAAVVVDSTAGPRRVELDLDELHWMKGLIHDLQVRREQPDAEIDAGSPRLSSTADQLLDAYRTAVPDITPPISLAR